MNIWTDIRLALRGFRRNPGFVAIAIVTLALGIGANGTIFSVVKGVLLSPLPYAEADRLAFIWNQFPGLGDLEMGVSANEMEDWSGESEIFEGVAGIFQGEQNAIWTLTVNGETEVFDGAFVTANFFDVMGVGARLGRTFLPEEGIEGNDNVVVLADAFWRSRFGADLNILGQRLTIRGEDLEVVGVMPPDFHTNLNVSNSQEADFWVVLFPNLEFGRAARFLNAIARLADGVTVETAQTRATSVAHNLQQAYPEAYQDEGYGVKIDPLQRRIAGDMRIPLMVLMGTVGVVLLISAMNVGNLLLIRAESRQREIAVRSALGAGSRAVIRQFVTESVLLTVAGGVVALLLSYGGVQLLRAVNPGNLPRIDLVRIDGLVIGFTAAVVAVVGVVLGVVPGLHAARTDINSILRDGGRGATGGVSRQRVRSLFVMSQMALAVLLVIGAGLLLRSLRAQLDIDLGIRSESVLSMRFDLPAWQYPEIEQVLQRHEEVLDKVLTLPNVLSASVAHAEHPLRLNGRWYFNVVGRPVDPEATLPLVGIRVVSQGHLETLGIPLLAGRNFDEFDRGDAPIRILINQSMAESWFPNEDPIGKRLIMARGNPDPQPMEIIGVVGDVKNEGIKEDVRSTFLFPLTNPSFASGWRRHMTLHVRTNGDPAAMIPTVREAVAEVDPALPVTKIKTLDMVVSATVAGPRFVTILLGLFAGLALLLAAIGIYGVVSYSVAQRTQELGVRMALGAGQGNILRLVMKQGVGLAVVGVLAGSSAAFLMTRLLSGILWGVSATDPLTFASVSLFLIVVAALATYVPAWRASRIDPVECLRQE
ncbi:MAG: ABC transporter permease [Gemmatimonadetes bacterium]|nr:ABC transporter permease [Gemmatimonadota bacterium]